MKGIFNKLFVALSLMSAIPSVYAGSDAVVQAAAIAQAANQVAFQASAIAQVANNVASQAAAKAAEESVGFLANASSNMAIITAPFRAIYTVSKRYSEAFYVNPVYVALGTALMMYGSYRVYQDTKACYNEWRKPVQIVANRSTQTEGISRGPARTFRDNGTGPDPDEFSDNESSNSNNSYSDRTSRAPKAAPVKKETAAPKAAPVKKETATQAQSQPVGIPAAPVVVPIAKPAVNTVPAANIPAATTSAPAAKTFTLEQFRKLKPAYCTDCKKA